MRVGVVAAGDAGDEGDLDDVAASCVCRACYGAGCFRAVPGCRGVGASVVVFFGEPVVVGVVGGFPLFALLLDEEEPDEEGYDGDEGDAAYHAADYGADVGAGARLCLWGWTLGGA